MMKRTIRKNNTLYQVDLNIYSYRYGSSFARYKRVKNVEEKLKNDREFRILTLIGNVIGALGTGGLFFTVLVLDSKNFINSVSFASIITTELMIATLSLMAFFVFFACAISVAYDVFFGRIEDSFIWYKDSNEDYDSGVLIKGEKQVRDSVFSNIDEDIALVKEFSDSMSDEDFIDFIEKVSEYKKLSELNKELLKAYNKMDKDSFLYVDAKQKYDNTVLHLEELKNDCDSMYKSRFENILINYKNKNNSEDVLQLFSKIDDTTT